MRSNTSSKVKSILWMGLIAGTLDALAAIIVYKADPVKLFQFIASGALGNEAFGMGYTAAILGVLFHYLIATVWSALFFFIYPSVKKISWIVLGIVYGILVWIVMNAVVLPLSKITTGEFDLTKAAIAAAILIFAVGLPISGMTAKARK